MLWIYQLPFKKHRHLLSKHHYAEKATTPSLGCTHLLVVMSNAAVHIWVEWPSVSLILKGEDISMPREQCISSTWNTCLMMTWMMPHRNLLLFTDHPIFLCGFGRKLPKSRCASEHLPLLSLRKMAMSKMSKSNPSASVCTKRFQPKRQGRI